MFFKPQTLVLQEQLDAAAEADSDAAGLKERVATLERDLAAARKDVKTARAAHRQVKASAQQLQVHDYCQHLICHRTELPFDPQIA